ncbi:MAG: hypothetical protein V3V33_14455 [Candidatus Lokiarchaeia archaeon]
MEEYIDPISEEEELLAKKIDNKIRRGEDLSGDEFYIPIKSEEKRIHEYEEEIESSKSKGTITDENYFIRADLDIHIRVPIAFMGRSGVKILYPSVQEALKVQKLDQKYKINELNQKLIQYGEGIVGLLENWNGEKSKAITLESWNYSTNLVKKILYNLWDQAYDIPIPLILVNTDGSYDVDWQTSEFELLINLPSGKKDLVHIYGEKLGFPEYELEVRINYDLVQGVIIEWIKKIL